MSKQWITEPDTAATMGFSQRLCCAEVGGGNKYAVWMTLLEASDCRAKIEHFFVCFPATLAFHCCQLFFAITSIMQTLWKSHSPERAVQKAAMTGPF